MKPRRGEKGLELTKQARHSRTEGTADDRQERERAREEVKKYHQ